MEKLINYFLDIEFYYCAVNNSVYSINDDFAPIPYIDLQTMVMKTFYIEERLAYSIVFNWLLKNDVKLVMKNWNTRFIVHNVNIYEKDNTTTTMNADVGFEYELILNDD